VVGTLPLDENAPPLAPDMGEWDGGGTVETDPEPDVLDTPTRLLELDEKAASFMRGYLDAGLAVMKEYVGGWYGQTRSLNADWRTKRPVSRMRMMIDAYLPVIAPRTLEFFTEPLDASQRGKAQAVEWDLNRAASELQLATLSREVALDSIAYGYAQTLTMRAEGLGMLWAEAERIDPDREFVVRVSPWDYAVDHTSTHKDMDQWRRVRIRPSFEHVKALGLFDPDLLEECRGDVNSTWRQAPRLDNQGDVSSTDELLERIELRVYFIYRGGKCLIGIASPLMPQRWLLQPDEYPGFEFGPLTPFEPKPVNDSRMSVSPAAQLMELHLMIAAIGSKAGNQALKAKAFINTKGKGVRIARELDFADDYAIIESDQDFRVQTVGGIMPEVVNALQTMSTEFDAHSANVRQASGMSTGADTATEVATLQQNSMTILNDLAEAHEEGMGQVGTLLAKWRQIAPPPGPQVYPIRLATGRMANAIWTPEMREGDAIDATVKVRPMTHQVRDPNIRSARMIQAIDVAFDKAQKAAMFGWDPMGVFRGIGIMLREPGIEEIMAAGTANAGAFQAQQQQQAQQQAMLGAGPSGGQPPRGGPKPIPGTKTGRPIDAVRSAMAPGVPQGIR